MSAEATLIAEIVQRVLKELGTAPGGAPPAATARPAASSSPPAVLLDAPVITRELLENGANGATRIHTRRGALLTPSARDFLRERRIEVVVETARVAEPAQAAAPRCRVLLARGTPQVAAAVVTARTAGIVDEPRIVGTAAEAAAEATSLLCRGDAPRVVVFSDEPELIACLANRNERVRAVAVPGTAGLERLRASMKPNLFATSPEGRSEFEIVRLLKTIHLS
jgi:hypothetical protein